MSEFFIFLSAIVNILAFVATWQIIKNVDLQIHNRLFLKKIFKWIFKKINLTSSI